MRRWRSVGVRLARGLALAVVGGLLLLTPGDPAMFRARYEVPANVPILGPISGVLQDSGERLELQWPEEPGTNGLAFITVDEVRYNDRAPWPFAADGSGAPPGTNAAMFWE